MKYPVKVFFEEVTEIKINRTELNRWIKQVIGNHGASLKFLNIVLCSDKYLLKLNKEYLGHDTFTDIITFHYQEKESPVEGELFISLDRVKDNAAELGLDLKNELDRVIIHGVLHLLGFDDTTPELREEMRRIEDYCLTLRA